MSNWKKIPLGKILTESKVISENPDADRRITVLLYGRGVEKRPITSEKEGATKYHIRRAGQFIYGKQNLHKGAFGVVPDELDGFESSSDIPAFDVDKSCLPEWIEYFLKQDKFYEKLSMIARGMASKRIHPEDFFLQEIPLPEPAEQKQILKYIHNKEKQHQLLVQEIQHQQLLLKRIRQSILHDAVKGKLVPQNPKDEPASELLNRIKAEKEKLIKQGKIKKEKPLPPISESEIPYELPKGWTWCRLGEITTYGSSPKAEPKELPENTWILDLEDIEKETSIILQRLTLQERPSTSTKNLFQKGDVLYSKLRPYLDKVVVADGAGACTTEILPLKCFAELNPEFFKITLKSKEFLAYVNSKVGGMKMPRLGTDEGRKALIPIAPHSEQSRIVEKVTELMALCASLEKEIAHSKQEADYLLNAILRETFQQKPKWYSQNGIPVSMAAEK